MSLSTSQSWQCVYVSEDNYCVYQGGSHIDGTFIRVYVPELAKKPGITLKTILYMHGFALCMPSFYEEHLVELVKAGYLVFFPDFQRSCYPNTAPKAPTPPRPSINHWQRWGKIRTQLSKKAMEDAISTEEIHSLLPDSCEGGDAGLGRGLSQFTAEEFRRVARATSLITLVLPIFSWFRRTYGKNLLHLLSTVALSLAHRPTEWLADSIALTEDAWDYLCKQEHYAHWPQTTVETFAFGHSLGGLIALSLPDYLKRQKPDSRFLPKKFVAADPAASTEMGIPRFAIWLLKLFGSPFTAAPISIQETGHNLTEPVVILHGGSDKLVPPRLWKSSAGESSVNYAAIESSQKAIYFSYSNPKLTPPLKAFHNQAVTCTEYYDDALFENFGGVKKGPNAYNRSYIWPGIGMIFSDVASPDNLLDHFPHGDFDIKTVPPQKKLFLIEILPWIIGILAALLIGYWIWENSVIAF